MNRHNTIVALGYPDIELAHCQYCDDDEAEESTAHILAECEAFGIERHHIFGHIMVSKITEVCLLLRGHQLQHQSLASYL